jgi:hypothetical protein
LFDLVLSVDYHCGYIFLLMKDTINLSTKNALGRVFWTLPKDLREEIFQEAIRLRKNESRQSFRQYFFLNSKNNPARLDSKIKEVMIKTSPQFQGCFVPNKLNNQALERLASAA